MKHIANCSFGKDSMAAILVCLEHGIKIDEVLYCKIMFDSDLSAEYPEHEKWIHSHAIPLLKDKYGLGTTIVQAKRSYSDIFYAVKKKGDRIGDIYGFPFIRRPWCNSMLKTQILNRYMKKQGEYLSIIGIAADEYRRIESNTKENVYLPLVQYGITEDQAFKICSKADLLSPAYKSGIYRLGCWFCHNQGTGDLRRLRNNHPDLYAKFLQLDKDTPEYASLRIDKTLHDIERQFQFEDKQMSLTDLIEQEKQQ